MSDGWGDAEWGSSLWGGGAYPYDPIDITYITCTYTPVAERASYAQVIAPIGSYKEVAIKASSTPALPIGDNAYAPSISEDASYVPTYSKVGTP